MLATLFRRRPGLPVVSIPKQAQPPLFKIKPPLWARWALVLVSLDVMVATSAIELTWNHWTIAPDHEKDSPNGTETPPVSSEPNKPALQPVWMRSAACLIHFLSGCAVAGSILATRSRVVRSMTVVSQHPTNSTAGPRLYLETAGHPENYGYEIYLKRCKLVEWKNNRLSLEVKGQGRWLLDMRGASINGASAYAAPSLSRDYMLRAWQMARQPDTPSISKIPKKKVT